MKTRVMATWAAGAVAVALFVGACTATTAGDPVEAIRSGEAIPPSVALATAQQAASIYYSENNSYAGFNAATAQQIEPSVQWNDEPTAVTGQVSIRGASPTSVALVAGGTSGTACAALTSGTVTATGTQDAASAAECTG